MTGDLALSDWSWQLLNRSLMLMDETVAKCLCFATMEIYEGSRVMILLAMDKSTKLIQRKSRTSHNKWYNFATSVLPAPLPPTKTVVVAALAAAESA